MYDLHHLLFILSLLQSKKLLIVYDRHALTSRHDQFENNCAQLHLVSYSQFYLHLNMSYYVPVHEEASHLN